MPTDRRSEVAIGLTLACAVLLMTVYALGVYLAPRPARPAQPTSNSRAARAETSEYRFWRQQQAVATPAAAATATATAIPAATTTPAATSSTLPVTALDGGSVHDAFTSAASEFGVPLPLLQSICYLEGRLSMNAGLPSIDNGFGCMHLVLNANFDTLDQAATDLAVAPAQIKSDIATNIRGGAAVLRDDALRASPTHTLPSTLGDWYAALTIYSSTSTASVAALYANAVYNLLKRGFSGTTDSGETITLAPQPAPPNVTAAGIYQPRTTYPTGCTAPDANTDYPGAVDCILNPNVYDCAIVTSGTSTAPCTYDGANRPSDYAISFIAIHDIEGTVAAALSTFQNVNNGVSIHYIVGADGTVYQVLHEKDIAWHAGNYWYNQHAIGIEHEGYDATGYQWYNATEYLASAKLTAYLLKKYNIPLDRYHVVAHGSVPSPDVSDMPNHVDPGPYWLWGYYFNLIHEQGVPYPAGEHAPGMFTMYPAGPPSAQPYSGAPPPSKVYSFFSLHTGPSTKSPLIPNASSTDFTDETSNVEDGLVYYYVAKQPDQAGTGDTMYEIWYGESDNLARGSQSMDAHLAWLAAPLGLVIESQANALTNPWLPTGALVQLQGSGASLPVYGKPVTDASFVLGDAPSGAIFVSGYTVNEDGTSNKWFEIDYNHRQAWVPAKEITMLAPGPGPIVLPQG